MKILSLLILLIALTITSVAQDGAVAPYEIVAKLGDGLLGNAVFSPDNTHLAIATSQGIELYQLDNDSVTKYDTSTDQNSPLNNPSIFVAFTADSQSLIFVEPVKFGVYLTSIYSNVESVRVWQVDIEDFEATNIIAEVDVHVRQIEYLQETNQLIFANIFLNIHGSVRDIKEYVVLDVVTGQVQRPDINTIVISAYSTLRNTDDGNYTIDSSNGEWQFRHYRSSEDYVQTWYEIVRLADETVAFSSFDEVDSINPVPWEMRFSSDTEITIVEDPRCGTGFMWNWQENTVERLAGYGGCGDDRSCHDRIGDEFQYCISVSGDDYQTLAVFYDWYYLDQHPDTPYPDFSYEVNEHTDGILYYRVIANTTIVTGSQDNSAIIWHVDLTDHAIELSVRLRLEHPAPVTYVGYNPMNYKEIMTASANKLYVWNGETGELQYVLTGHLMPVVRVAVKGNSFASYSTDGVVTVWKVIN